jgi:hypothetical protein
MDLRCQSNSAAPVGELNPYEPPTSRYNQLVVPLAGAGSSDVPSIVSFHPKASRPMRVQRIMVSRVIFSLIAVFTLTVACDRRQWGFPRTEVSVPSPDGRHVAFVKNHPEFDPPNQSLWVDGVQLKHLAADQDWCHTIVWSSDSSKVAFLVQDLQLVTVDVKRARIASASWLAEPGGYPPRFVAREVALSSEGQQATFRVCERLRTSGAPETCAAPQSITLSTAP